MNLDRVRRETDDLAKIQAARADWAAAIDKIANTGSGFMGPQGVSSNSAFRDAAMKLFDDHVRHLIERHRTGITIALDVS